MRPSHALLLSSLHFFRLGACRRAARARQRRLQADSSQGHRSSRQDRQREPGIARPQAVVRSAPVQQSHHQLQQLPQPQHRRQRQRADLHRPRLAERPAQLADRSQRGIQCRAVLGRTRQGPAGTGQGPGASQRRNEQHARARRRHAQEHPGVCRRVRQGLPQRQRPGQLRQHGLRAGGLRGQPDHAELAVRPLPQGRGQGSG